MLLFFNPKNKIKVKTKLLILIILCISIFVMVSMAPKDAAWIRINLLGYKPTSIKVAVWTSKNSTQISSFQLVEANNHKVVFEASAGKVFGAYGPFTETYRLDFSNFQQSGKFYLKAGNATSPVFQINEHVYDGTADFCLRYMRQQRSGFNPYLKDSCHTHDGYSMYGPMPDSTHIDASGGWHDASDYLQYSATSANATYHLLAAWRDFPSVFTDFHQANGLDGKNGLADVLDEARWGLDWLLKMHPKSDWMFNQLGDDRDHISMRIPKEDSQYGKGFERPLYFCSGSPQGLFKYKNRATGVASTAGKFSSAFALGTTIFSKKDPKYAQKLHSKANSAFEMGLKQPGVCQTAPGGAPYFYEEDNWTDDMELAAAALQKLDSKVKFDLLPSKNLLAYSLDMAQKEPITPWIKKDTARHYQWYPFINIGHFELAKQLKGAERKKIIDFYKEGIEIQWQKSQKNAFYRSVPFIWCSNNLTTAFAIQCLWYRQLSNDLQYAELEQANFDWLFGCNPWGTSFVYGLPAWGDTPQDPHSAFTHLKNYPIDGGMVDGPVYGQIFKNLIGIKLYSPDEYTDFQSNLVVYHDDYGDYSTNEPTMDGVASLTYLMAAKEFQKPNFTKKKP